MNSPESTETDKSLLRNIEGFLQKIVETMNEAELTDNQQSQKAGRKKILPSLVLWSGVLVGILRGFKRQSEVWRLVSWQGFWKYAPSKVGDQAVYNRLDASDDKTLQKLFLRVRDGLRIYLSKYAQNHLAPFATGVYAIDGSTLDKMARMLSSMREIPNGDSQLLAGKMVGLFDIRLQQWCDILHFKNPNQNDKLAAAKLVKPLEKGSLILADLGFFSFAWFDQLTDWEMWWVSRFRKKVTFEVLHTFYTDGENLFDGIVWLGKYRSDKAAHAVRLVTFSMNGQHFRYLTNVLDPKKLSMHEIAQLYARRWDIELAFKALKRHLNLHLIWSSKPTVILHQLWGTLIISQLLHAVQLEIAGLAKVDPFDVSLDLVTQYVPQLAANGQDPIEMIVKHGRRMGFIRPSRRIRPKTPPIGCYDYHPVPEGMILKRKSRYANRRGRTADDPPILATQASSLEPILC